MRARSAASVVVPDTFSANEPATPVSPPLAPEVAPFDIKTMLVEPGFFRTELLSPQSTQYAERDMVAAANPLAVDASVAMLAQGGSDYVLAAQSLGVRKRRIAVEE